MDSNSRPFASNTASNPHGSNLNNSISGSNSSQLNNETQSVDPSAKSAWNPFNSNPILAQDNNMSSYNPNMQPLVNNYG